MRDSRKMKRRLTALDYYGYTAMDPRFSTKMLAWIVMEVKRFGKLTKISVGIENGHLRAFTQHFEKLFEFSLNKIIRWYQYPETPEEFFLLVRSEKLINFYLFRGSENKQVSNLLNTIDACQREMTSTNVREISRSETCLTKNVGFGNTEMATPWNADVTCRSQNSLSIQKPGSLTSMRTVSDASSLNLASLSADLSPSCSHFFEVLYVGKVKVSNRKVPDTIIDDALEKFTQHEAEKLKRRASLLSNQTTSSTTSSRNNSIDNTPDKPIIIKPDTPVNIEPKHSETKLAVTFDEKIRDKSPSESDFDKFSKERLKACIKKPAQIALEPNVLILNIQNTNNNNLTTLKEEDADNVKDDVFDDTKVIHNNDDLNNIFAANKNKVQNLMKIQNTDTNYESTMSDLIKVQESLNIDANLKSKSDMNLHNQNLRTDLDNFEIGTSGILPENKPFLRDRSASIGSLSFNKTPIAQLIGEQNRTMLFQVGNTELRLISPDRKQVLLRASLNDVSCAASGKRYSDHAGFVCREVQSSNPAQTPFVCYCFKCESPQVATELVNAIKLSFIAHAEEVKKCREKSPNITSCEHCPMLWYHRLCHDLEGVTEKRTHALILRRIEQLSENEQESLITKYRAATSNMYETSEHNAFLMMLLRTHCEAKQQRHVHDTAENRSEFINQYLGSGGTIFMKAKRSLSSGFDNLLKRKSSHHDIAVNNSSRRDSEDYQTQSSENVYKSKSSSPQAVASPPVTLTVNDHEIDSKKEDSSSPMLDIYMKVGDTKSSPEEIDNDSTWRQDIFRRVLSHPNMDNEAEITQKSLLNIHDEKEKYQGRRTRAELRELWKMAIDQTILLVRMERENERLKENEGTSAVRRIKLEYDDIIPCTAGAASVWENLLASRDTPPQLIDTHILRQAVRQGVNRHTRGAVWYFLAEQSCLRSAPPDAKLYPGYYTPYRTLLAGLTKHQHAILIDLGRTFPQHTFFSSALGPGQLSLYNILKAYSLLDPEVGYCQGLSFVAGLLLLHMEESEAFILLRHLMFRRGLRKQYLPDMSALQVQLYQLSRLIRDHEPELHIHLEKLDVSCALIAAPWMLTLFTSQFPLGFAARVFDLIFLDAMEAVFAVSLALLSTHKEALLMCESCEEIVEYLRHKMPDMDPHRIEKLFKKVFSLDITRQLFEYCVEYGVLREEMPKIAQLNKLKDQNEKLSQERTDVMAQLDDAMDSLANYQSNQLKLESQVRSLEHQLSILSRFTSSHYRQDSLPLDVRRICQSHSKKVNFGKSFLKVPSEDEEDIKSLAKTGKSTPNLFAKLSKEELSNLTAKATVEDKKSQLKKSMSVNSGLIAPKSTTLDKGGFALSQEQIRENRLKAQQMKNDFNENLKRLNQRLYPDKQNDDVSIFQSKKSMSLNVNSKISREIKCQKSDSGDIKTPEHNKNPFITENNNETLFKNLSDASDIKFQQSDRSCQKFDSGFVTPMTPTDDTRSDSCSIISHPLSDCDVEIKFDGHSTKLKSLSTIKQAH